MHSYYFDHNATTPIAEEVLETLNQTLRGGYGNASSIHHLGQAARQTVENARYSVSRLLNCDPKEIVFGSGGTEADNQAIFSAVSLRERPHVITSAIEHPAVLNSVAELRRRGARVTVLPVSSVGLVDPQDVKRALAPDTSLISIMHVNNETGAIQPIEEIAAIAQEAGVPMHSDGVQAAGRIAVDVKQLGVDLYSTSAHKLRGPKGVGALYVRMSVQLPAMLFGGRHEAGRRAGTENVPGIAAMGTAASIASETLMNETERIESLRRRFETGLRERIEDVSINGGGAPRVPNTSNICFEGIEGESMVIALDLRGFCVSSGSACSSGAVEPSHVLLAMGLTRQQAKSSVRFSMGHGNNTDQVDQLVEAVVACARHLRRLSPTYTAHV